MGGKVTLQEPYSQIEVGLHYDSVVTTMRPAIQNSVIEGLPRSWDKLWARFDKTWGGKIGVSQEEAEIIEETMVNLDNATLFTGDSQVSAQQWDTDGRVTVIQDAPYPMTLLTIFGTISVGDHD